MKMIAQYHAADKHEYLIQTHYTDSWTTVLLLVCFRQ